MAMITIDNEVPHIWTKHGHMKISDLKLEMKREDVPGTVVLVEEYTFQGEIVKRGVHLCPMSDEVCSARFGVQAGVEAGGVNG